MVDIYSAKITIISVGGLLIGVGGLLGGMVLVANALEKIGESYKALYGIIVDAYIALKVIESFKYVTNVDDSEVTRYLRKYSDGTWNEFNEHRKVINVFNEDCRDANYINIIDKVREIKLQIPIKGGWMLITGSQRGWVFRGGQDYVNQTGPIYFVMPVRSFGLYT